MSRTRSMGLKYDRFGRSNLQNYIEAEVAKHTAKGRDAGDLTTLVTNVIDVIKRDNLIVNYVQEELKKGTEQITTSVVEALTRDYLLWARSSKTLQLGDRTVSTDARRDLQSNEFVTQDYVWSHSLFHRAKLNAYDGKLRRVVNVADGVDDMDVANLRTLRREIKSEIAKLKAVNKLT